MAQGSPADLGVKLSRWFFYTVIISLVPIILDYFVLLAREQERSHPFTEVLGHGELYLLSSVFLCVGVGEVVGSGPKNQIGKVIVGGLAIVILVFAIGLYVVTKNFGSSVGDFFATPSIWFFVASLAVSTSCIALGGNSHAQ